MAKRSARYKVRENNFADDKFVHPVFPARGGWNPRDGEARDRKYVKNVRAMSPTQQRFMDAIDERAVALALGPAGTGKTYLAIAKAVEALEMGKVGRIVLSRPAVEAGERLGGVVFRAGDWIVFANLAGLALALDGHGKHEGEGVLPCTGWAGEDERVGQTAGTDGGAQRFHGGSVAEKLAEAGGERGCGVHGALDLTSSINGSGG